MALASQNSRPDRSAPNSRSASRFAFAIIAVVAFGAIIGARWIFSGAPDGAPAPRSASAAEPITTEPANQTRRTALDEAIADAGTTPTDVKTEPTTAPAAQPEAKPADNVPAAVRAEPATAPAAQPPAATPDQPKLGGDGVGGDGVGGDGVGGDGVGGDGVGGDTLKKEAPKDPADTTSPVATPPASREKEPFFGNGFNASNPPVAPASGDGASTAPPADSPAGKLKEGLALAGSEPVKARALLSAAMLSGTLAEPEARSASNALAHISAQLFLTPVFNASDSACFQYTVQPNDSLEKIVRKNKIGCDWRLVARLNNIKKPESIQVGKRLKLPKGPFSAVVSKRDYRIDICVGEGSDRVIVASMPVGLGEANGTPVGMFKVKSGSKLLNPEWVHPVTGKRYEANDADNPIGEHWLGLEGTEDKTSKLKGYGIHGTIEPDSIGQNRSLGCVRLLADDVAVVWECLGDGAIVEIRAN